MCSHTGVECHSQKVKVLTIGLKNLIQIFMKRVLTSIKLNVYSPDSTSIWSQPTFHHNQPGPFRSRWWTHGFPQSASEASTIFSKLAKLVGKLLSLKLTARTWNLMIYTFILGRPFFRVDSKGKISSRKHLSFLLSIGGREIARPLSGQTMPRNHKPPHFWGKLPPKKSSD